MRATVVRARGRLESVYNLSSDLGAMIFGCDLDPGEADAPDSPWEQVAMVRLEAGVVKLEQLPGEKYHQLNTEHGYRTPIELMCVDASGATVYPLWHGHHFRTEADLDKALAETDLPAEASGDYADAWP